MTTSRAERLVQLDDDMVQVLSQSPPESGHRRIIQLSTTSADGRPHLALLGDAELHAVDATTVRLLVWGTSTTAANISERPQLLVSFVHDGSFVVIDLDVDTTRWVDVLGRKQLMASATVAGARRDRVPYAAITSGPTFTLLDESVQERWQLSIGLLRSLDAEDD
jgi:hypothetical protein